MCSACEDTRGEYVRELEAKARAEGRPPEGTMIVVNPLAVKAWCASAVLHLMSLGAISYRVPASVPVDGLSWRLGP